MPELKTIMGEIATEAADGEQVGCTDRATTTELVEAQELEREPMRRMSVYDIQRKQELDYVMGRGPKPLDGRCLDHRDNGVLDD